VVGVVEVGGAVLEGVDKPMDGAMEGCFTSDMHGVMDKRVAVALSVLG
jgi:hypothetical protein